MPKVSVIIPVFNVAPYVEKCAHSLFGQTLDDMEFIFVDDCSPDNSIELVKNVLEEYPSRKGQVKFLKNEQNLGLAGTRATGVKIAKGDYLIHCDSDDWVELDMYEMLYDRAKQTNADIVTCDYYEEYPKNSVRAIKEVFTNSHDNILNTSNKPFYTCWSHLIKRNVIFENRIFPVQGINMWEDFLVVIKAYYYAKTVEYVEMPLYHYNKLNENAITNKPFSDKYLEQEKACVKNLEEFFQDKEIDFTNTALMLKKMIKDRYLYQTPPNYKKWRACYPEAANVKLKFEKTNWIYDMAYRIGCLGIFTPLRLYYALTSLLHY